MDYISQYIKPELLTLIPVLYFIGAGFKNSSMVKDKYIPIILMFIGISLSLLWIMGTNETPASVKDWSSFAFIGITQGVLLAGGSVFVENLIKQSLKGE